MILAGPNGAGKTTASAQLLRDRLGVTEFVNADGDPRLIAEGGQNITTSIHDHSLWHTLVMEHDHGPAQ